MRTEFFWLVLVVVLSKMQIVLILMYYVCYKTVHIIVHTHIIDFYYQVNPEFSKKTDCRFEISIVIGTGARQRAEGSAGTLDLKCVSIKLATSVRSLGVRIDNTLSFNEHVDSVCKSSHFHLRALRHIRRHILADTAKTIACSMVDGQVRRAT